MLILDCFGFPKPRNDKEGRETRNMGMLRAGSFSKPHNDDKGGRGEGDVESKPAANPIRSQ